MPEPKKKRLSKKQRLKKVLATHLCWTPGGRKVKMGKGHRIRSVTKYNPNNPKSVRTVASGGTRGYGRGAVTDTTEQLRRVGTTHHSLAGYGMVVGGAHPTGLESRDDGGKLRRRGSGERYPPP